MRTIANTKGLGGQIREAREAAGLTQGELGEVAGLPQQHVSAIERDAMRPTIETVCRLADGLGVDWSYHGKRMTFRCR